MVDSASPFPSLGKFKTRQQRLKERVYDLQMVYEKFWFVDVWNKLPEQMEEGAIKTSTKYILTVT